MADVYIRRSSADRGGAAHANTANGTSYANAWLGLKSAGANTALTTESSDTIWLCGDHVVTAASVSGNMVYPRGSATAARPKIIRGDYPGDPARIFGGFCPASGWTQVGATTVWTYTIPYSWDDESGVDRIPMFTAAGAGASLVWLTRVGTLPACEATPNTFYLTALTGGSTLSVNVTGTPASNVVLPAYGYRMAAASASYRHQHVLYHAVEFYPVGRVGKSHSSGVWYYPRHSTWQHCRFEGGGATLFTFALSSGLTWRNTAFAKISSAAHIYNVWPTLDEAGGAIAAPARYGVAYNSTNVRYEQCRFSDAGNAYLSATADSHSIAMQNTSEWTVHGCVFERGYMPIGIMQSSEPTSALRNLVFTGNAFVEPHNLTNPADPTQATPQMIRFINGLTNQGDTSGCVVRHNWADGGNRRDYHPGTGAPFTFLRPGTAQQPHLVEYNQCVDMDMTFTLDSSVATIRYNTGWGCLWANAGGVAAAAGTIDNNRYVTDLPAAQEFYGDSLHRTRAAWQSGSYGYDINSQFATPAANSMIIVTSSGPAISSDRLIKRAA